MTDADALINIRTRLEGDVGFLIKLVEDHNQKVEAKQIPFWALLRTMFPIAEAIAGLLYGESEGKTQANMLKLFEEELCKYNINYKKCSAILILMYRHALTHTDLPRPITNKDGTITCTWGVGFGDNIHLSIYKGAPYVRESDGIAGIGISIPFEVKQFYNDLLRLLEDLKARDFGGELGKNYEAWKTYELIDNKPIHAQAERQIADLGKEQLPSWPLWVKIP